ATPYGVTSALDIPVIEKAADKPSGGIAWTSPPTLAAYVDFEQVGDAATSVNLASPIDPLRIQDSGSMARQDRVHVQLFLRLTALAGANKDKKIPLGVTAPVEIDFDANGVAVVPFSQIKDSVQEVIERFLHKSDAAVALQAQAIVGFDSANAIRRSATP